jgi:hypothetical protein
MTDNEFDHLFSKNLKNARSIINPDENDWKELSSKIDRFQSSRRNWLSFLPWLLLLLVSSYTLWMLNSMNKLEQSLVEISAGKKFNSILKDTIFLEKDIYIYETIYKSIPFNKAVKEFQPDNIAENRSFVEQNNPLGIIIEEDTLVKNKPWDPVDILKSGRNLSAIYSQQREINLEVKDFSEKKENKLKIKSNIGLSVGTLLPLNSNEIKKPVAMALHAEFEILPRFSIKPSVLYSQHIFELEDLNSTKIVLSTSNNPQGTFTLHEIKGIEKIIIPSIAFNYYFYRNKNLEGYSGIGVSSNFTLPTQLDYEFKDLTNNNSYKYSLFDKLGSNNISFFSNIGSKIHTKSAISFFGEVRGGISKYQTPKYMPFVAVLAGATYTF